MILTDDAGLWSTGPAVAAAPAVAVLELSGAVLSWTVDEMAGAAATHLAFTDVTAADWLWRVVGTEGHGALLAALQGRPPSVGQTVDVPAANAAPGPLAPLRRLAVGHWLRRWWPASAHDGIVTLDAAVLDGELALQTVAAQDYFTEATFDSDVAALLAPHRGTFADLIRFGDPRVAVLATACEELADELGTSAAPVGAAAPRSRDDYALAAGGEVIPSAARQLARGVGSVDWTAVPPGLFDAADQTIEWAVEVAAAAAVATVRVAVTAPVAGIEVRLRSGDFLAAGVLDATGRATLPWRTRTDEPVTETQAWNHDWASSTATVGVDVPGSATAAQTRQRLREFARQRLARPGEDAFLAELLAAEDDY